MGTWKEKEGEIFESFGHLLPPRLLRGPVDWLVLGFLWDHVATFKGLTEGRPNFQTS